MSMRKQRCDFSCDFNEDVCLLVRLKTEKTSFQNWKSSCSDNVDCKFKKLLTNDIVGDSIK